MATYDLNRAELNGLLTLGGIDPSVRKAIIDYLVNDGLLTGPGSTVVVQDQSFPPHNYPPLDSGTEVLFLTSPTDSVDTSTDPDLKVIVDVGDAKLNVTGSDDVLVATGPGVDLINMSGSTGNDVVMAEGADDISRGWGYDHVFGGGNLDTMVSGTVEDALVNNIWGASGNPDTIGGGDSGNNYGVGGDSGHNYGGSGETTTIIAGSGNDTLIGGRNDDLFEIGKYSNQTVDIHGGGGFNTVQFDDSFANATISTVGGVTTVHFKDDQTINMTDVQELVFHGGHSVKI